MLAPPRHQTSAGVTRRIGIEIEFSGVSCREAAVCLAGLFGGGVEEVDPHRVRLVGSRHGDFIIELDTVYAHPEEWDALDVGPTLQATAREVTQTICAVVGDVSGLFVPVEIVCPPVALDALVDLDRIVSALRQAGAEGTDEGLIFAFGTQLNIELPSLDVATILAYLRAYALLSPWLRQRIDPDFLRRMLPYINPYPGGYVQTLLDPGYRPSLPALMDDYLAANPTRNRELDLLPLFAHLGRELPEMNGKQVKARPALHYRLPDTRLSDPDWGLVVEWNRWAEVERLAADPAATRRLAAHCRGGAGSPLEPERWIEAIEQWRRDGA